MLRRWVLNVLIALDDLLSAILLGDPQETISSRLGKAMLKGARWACLLCRLLDRIQPDHCLHSIERDRGSKRLGEF